MDTQTPQTGNEKRARAPKLRKADIDEIGVTPSSVADLSATTGKSYSAPAEPLKSTIAEQTHMSAEKIEEDLDLIHPKSGTKTKHRFTESIKHDVQELVHTVMPDSSRFVGIKTMAQDALREVKGGVSKGLEQVKDGWNKGKHEFFAGIDRAMSKVLS